MPRISLCMIVRDEAEMLAGCLESAAPVVDEIVILDTGSTDSTREIAGRFGATIIPAAWADFSTARNQVIRRATGDWVLVLDADEELALETPERLRELVDSDEADAYALRIINCVEMAEFIDLEKSPQFHMVRLFKREGALYLNPIHERLRLAGGSRTARASGIDIIHYGFMPEIFEKKQKAARNRALLEQWVIDENKDPWAHFYLAREDEHDGNLAEAAKGYREALAVFIEDNDGAAAIDTYKSLADCCVRQGQTDEAGQTLAQGVLTVPGSIELRFAYGDLLLNTDNPEAAAEQFGECLSLHAEGLGAEGLKIVWERLAASFEKAGSAERAVLAKSAARPSTDADEAAADAPLQEGEAAALLSRLNEGEDVLPDILAYLFET